MPRVVCSHLPHLTSGNVDLNDSPGFLWWAAGRQAHCFHFFSELQTYLHTWHTESSTGEAPKFSSSTREFFFLSVSLVALSTQLSYFASWKNSNLFSVAFPSQVLPSTETSRPPLPSISCISSLLFYLCPHYASHQHHHLQQPFNLSSAYFPNNSIQWSHWVKNEPNPHATPALLTDWCWSYLINSSKSWMLLSFLCVQFQCSQAR